MVLLVEKMAGKDEGGGGHHYVEEFTSCAQSRTGIADLSVPSKRDT